MAVRSIKQVISTCLRCRKSTCSSICLPLVNLSLSLKSFSPVLNDKDDEDFYFGLNELGNSGHTSIVHSKLKSSEPLLECRPLLTLSLSLNRISRIFFSCWHHNLFHNPHHSHSLFAVENLTCRICKHKTYVQGMDIRMCVYICIR